MKDILERLIHMSGVHVNTIRSVCKMWNTSTMSFFTRVRSLPCEHKNCFKIKFGQCSTVFQECINDDIADPKIMFKLTRDKRALLQFCKIGGNIYNFLISICTLEEIKPLIQRCADLGCITELDKITKEFGDVYRYITFTTRNIEYFYHLDIIIIANLYDMDECLYKTLHNIALKYKHYYKLPTLINAANIKNIPIIPCIELLNACPIKKLSKRIDDKLIIKIIGKLYKQKEIDRDFIIKYVGQRIGEYGYNYSVDLLGYKIVLPFNGITEKEKMEYIRNLVKLRKHFRDGWILDFVCAALEN